MEIMKNDVMQAGKSGPANCGMLGKPNSGRCVSCHTGVQDVAPKSVHPSIKERAV